MISPPAPADTLQGEQRSLEEQLVVIDMQEAFRDPRSQWCVPRYDDAAARIARLAEHYPGRTIWTRFVRDPSEAGAWSDYYDRWPTFRVPIDSPVWDLTLPKRVEDPVVSLPTFSKWSAPLLDELAPHSTLVVCGVATDCCVLSTVLGAVDAGRRVDLVADACAGVTDEAHEQTIALLDLLHPMVRVVDTDEVLRRPAA